MQALMTKLIASVHRTAGAVPELLHAHSGGRCLCSGTIRRDYAYHLSVMSGACMRDL